MSPAPASEPGPATSGGGQADAVVRRRKGSDVRAVMWGALAIALLVPVGNGRPIASVLLDAIIGYLRAQAFVLSII